MVRTKVTMRRLPGKMRKLPAWTVNREYGKKKKHFSIQDKTSPTDTKNGEHNQERISSKNHQCKTKIYIFQWKKPPNLLIP